MNFFDSLDAVRLGPVSLGTILSALLVLIVCIILMRLVRQLADTALARGRLNKSLAGFLSSAIRVVLWILTALVVASVLGIPVASLLAVVSVAGLALSLALQDILANLFSGITLLSTSPFSVDEYVEIGGVQGTVTKVDLFYTTLTTLDSHILYLPNKTVTAGTVQNFSRAGLRRVDVPFTASYDTPTEAVQAAGYAAAARDPRILAEPAVQILLTGYDSSSIRYEARLWVRPDDYWDVLYAFNENLRTAFAEHGAEMSYEHLNVHMVG